jgi:cyanophycinase
MKKLLFLLFVMISAIQLHAKSLGRLGNAKDTSTATTAGFLLAGGSTDVDEAMRWFLQKSGGGDIVIIRASGGAGYNDYLFKLFPVNSVETLLINNREEAMLPETANTLAHAEAIFIAGGDQWNYINFWSNTPVQIALNQAIKNRNVPIGGTSAGLAVLGQFVFDAKMDGISSAEALNDIASPKISISKNFVEIDLLKNTITDSHYSQRTRMARHIAFLASIQTQYGIKAKGIGVDEKTALALEEDGSGKIFGSAAVYFLQLNSKKKNASTHPSATVYAVIASKEGTAIESLKDSFKKATETYTIENKALVKKQ